MTSGKSAYRQLCESEPGPPIFAQDWWLDSTVGNENWDVAVVELDGQVVASLPYVRKKKLYWDVCSQPPLTPALGPWIRPLDAKPASRLARDKELMNALIDQLPAFHLYQQGWHYSQTNWLPFFWRGFEQTTRYTYRIPDLSDSDFLWAQLQGNIRREIKKASKRFSLQVRDDLDIDQFLELNAKTFARQGRELPYSSAYVERIDKACAARDARRILIAVDQEGEMHAGAYLVWDEDSAYYLMGGADPALRNSGAASLVMWEAILLSASVTRSFDFEGSMKEPIERFFRSFGAQQVPYSVVTRVNSPLLSLLLYLKSAVRKASD